MTAEGTVFFLIIITTVEESNDFLQVTAPGVILSFLCVSLSNYTLILIYCIETGTNNK